MTRIFFVAGEPSGDMHGANLIRALRTLEPGVELEGLGGRMMEEAGMRLRHDLAAEAIMGFAEVVRSLTKIRRLFHETLARITAWRPDCLVIIDYPGFNIALAKRAAALGIAVVYYISPQVWAWKKKRIHTIARIVKKMLVILPFEAELYGALGVDCVYVGHPLFDHLERVTIEGRYREGAVVGILPGSREQEIRRILPVMLEVARRIRGRFPEARFVAPCVDKRREEQIRRVAGGFPLETDAGGMYEILDGARFCLVASGTATVETALFGKPMVILYRVAPLTYWIAKRLVNVEHIGMVNILAGERIVPEFVQHEATVDRIAPVALELMADGAARSAMITDLERLRASLGGPGASLRAAREILAVAEAAHGG